MSALLAGDIIPAVAELSYTPALTATTTDPTLGTGSTVLGRYSVDYTGWVRGQINIAFGSSGTSAGSGTYLLSLPTAIDTLASSTSFAGADVIGWGAVRDNSSVTTGSRMVIACRNSASGGTGGVGLVTLAALDGTNGAVSSAAPFAWGASDSITLQFAYPGA